MRPLRRPLAEALPLFWGENWGYLAEEGIKPVWIGEWSAPTETPARDSEPATLRPCLRGEL